MSDDTLFIVIDWFKARGVYVGGGVPYQWRSETGSARVGFLPVYPHLDLLQPWAVGAFRNDTEIDNHWNSIVLPDLQWCATNNVSYQRVLFPGFAWSNWNGGSRNCKDVSLSISSEDSYLSFS